MVIKSDPRKLLDLMATKHRDKDPDEEFLDRLAKKTSFYDQPSELPETLNPPLPAGSADAAAELDGLADVKIDDGSEDDEAQQEGAAGPAVLQVAEPPVDAEAAAAAARQRAEHEKKEARYAALFEGRSAGGSQQGSMPDNLDFSRLTAKAEQQALPEVGASAVSQEEAEAAAEEAEEDAARRRAWIELNQLRDQQGQASAVYRAAHDRFVATWGHRGAELRE